MKKKVKGRILAILMSLAMVFTMMLMVEGEAYADSDTEDTIGGVKYTLTFDNVGNGTVSVTGCDSDLGGEVKILDKVKFNGIEYPVTSIAGNSLSFKSYTSISIPASVKSIGEGAFQYCESLGTVVFASNSQLESIGGGAFQGTAITSIIIPAGVKSIGEGAFQYCESLGTVTFPANSQLESIGKNAFKRTAITSISIPAGVKSIGEYAFYYCKSLKTVTFASNSQLESIGGGAFQGTAITSIIIPASVTSIGGSAFKGTAITSIIIPASVTSIGGYAFDCSTLITVYYVGTEDQWRGIIDSEWDGNLGISVVFVKGVAYAPSGKTLTYNGEEQTGVATGEGYTLLGESKTNAGSYTATATLEEGYVWSDGKTDPKEIIWKINKAAAKVTPPVGKTFTYNGKAQTGVAAGTGYSLTGTTKATKAGTYEATATLKTDTNYAYKWSDGTTTAKSITWSINKAANPLTIKAKTATVKYSKVKKKAQTLAVGKVITFTKKGQGKMTYKLVSAKKGKKNFKKKFKINSKTGKVTVMKGLKKGTYKVKNKVRAAGNANYNASAWKTVALKITVK